MWWAPLVLEVQSTGLPRAQPIAIHTTLTD